MMGSKQKTPAEHSGMMLFYGPDRAPDVNNKSQDISISDQSIACGIWPGDKDEALRNFTE